MPKHIQLRVGAESTLLIGEWKSDTPVMVPPQSLHLLYKWNSHVLIISVTDFQQTWYTEVSHVKFFLPQFIYLKLRLAWLRLPFVLVLLIHNADLYTVIFRFPR